MCTRVSRFSLAIYNEKRTISVAIHNVSGEDYLFCITWKTKIFSELDDFVITIYRINYVTIGIISVYDLASLPAIVLEKNIGTL